MSHFTTSKLNEQLNSSQPSKHMKIQNEHTDSQDLDIAKVVPKVTTLIPDTKVADRFIIKPIGHKIDSPSKKNNSKLDMLAKFSQTQT